MGDEGRRAVDVADGERAGGGNIGGQGGLGQGLRVGREDRGGVGAEGVEGDRGQRAGGAGDRERVGVGRAGGKPVVGRGGRGRSEGGRVGEEGRRVVVGLSTSLMVSVPAVEISAARLVSVRVFVSAERTAASLVPRMLRVTEVSVPSALATANVSV